MHRRTFMAATAALARPIGAAVARLGPVLAPLYAPTLRAAPASGVRPRALVFPADFGAHPDTRIEWWYLTGWLSPAPPGHATGAASVALAGTSPPPWGFQLTFFRSKTEVPPDHPSRFAASQLLFAHAALTDVVAGRLRHDQRMARAGFGLAQAAQGDTRVNLRDWALARSGPPGASQYEARWRSDVAGVSLDLKLSSAAAPLLQGQAGYSRKGPSAEQASHYYSQAQLQAAGTLTLDGRAHAVSGRAWLDHEWSNSLLDPQAEGWDWLGMNLNDGSALTAFRLRRSDGSTLYAGGSFRGIDGALRNFGPGEVQLSPGRWWVSSATQARYPVQWQLTTPAGRFSVQALLDNQELDSRASTGTVYWEGLSALRDEQGRVVGHGYLEMTGYAGRLRLP